jgi:hypothetical protein
MLQERRESQANGEGIGNISPIGIGRDRTTAQDHGSFRVRRMREWKYVYVTGEG